MSEGLQQQIANLNAAQRVGIVAAVALSSFAVYATKKHKNICGGPVDSPRHRDACPLHFLTCAPNNDINSSIANIQDTLASAASTANESLNTIAQTANTALADFDMDPSHWKLPDLPTVSLPSIPTIRCPPEPLLGCAHDEGFFTHPHSQSCLQCNHSHRASNILDRGYLDWSTWSSPADDSPSEPDSPQQLESYSLLDCPVQHQNTFDESAPTCSSCEEERSQSSSPGSRSSASSAMSSIKSMVSRLGRDAVNLNLSDAPLVGDAARMIAAVGSGVTSSMGSMADAARSGAVGGSRDGAVGRRAGLGRTALYFFFWYLCTLCNDQFRIKNKGTILARFPAPHLLQAFGFAFQYYFVQELQKHKFNFFPAPTNHYTWTSNMSIVIPIAIAASFDIALELNQGGSDDQFNKLCKSTSPLFILILTYILNFETPTFKLTTSIASITTGSLLTIAKALDYNYELPDVLALMTGAFFSASRWIGAQYLLQKEDNGSPIVTMGRMAPWMAICILVFSIIFEKSWLMITRIDYFFESPIDMLEGLGQLLIFYVLWTLEILADFLLITNTGAITFIVAKLLKTVGDLGTEIFKKGFYYEERHWIERKKIMNEETIGLHYIGFGLVLFLWHRYQNWASNRGGGGGADGSGGASRGRSNSSSGGGAYGGLDGHGGGGEDAGAGANGGGSGGGHGGGGANGSGGACGGLCGGACACGRGAECSAGSCAGSCGRGAECSARPEAGDASQCAPPREVVTEPACPKQC